ncbi:MAG TPA: hypothetical protein VLY20_10130 [Nitrospiria bacterium]|nr:hypothetical protein [Nitrospiria bacterium]
MRKQADELQAGSLEGKMFDRKAVETVWDEFMKGRAHWSRPWATLVAAHFDR